MREIRRVEKAIQALEVPTHISKECLSNRQRRLDTDLVQDNAENQLLKVSPLRFLSNHLIATILTVRNYVTHFLKEEEFECFVGLSKK